MKTYLRAKNEGSCSRSTEQLQKKQTKEHPLTITTHQFQYYSSLIYIGYFYLAIYYRQVLVQLGAQTTSLLSNIH